MRLKHLKLAGFKSFVDPTVIPFTQSLSAVVGPNGCGKSNIIDAVRWVLGESSAKNLRGDDMSDVIFNGSNARKPVSVASVELLFDNSEGRAQGPWQQFSDIAIKRQVSRQGQSDYFVNGQKCRRRDIADLLSGTGLGPRSYSIIEQGTISRLVESKPAELRGFIEDAAGISKYKERKRDTLNRIKNSRDNLERLGDLYLELKTQIDSLETQAKDAQEYTALKTQERQLQTDIVVNRWQTFSRQLEQTQTSLVTGEQALAETEQDAVGAAQQDADTDVQLTQYRAQLNQANESYHEHQTDITSLSLNIEHLIQAQSQSQHLSEQLRHKKASLETQVGDIDALIAQHISQIEQQQVELAPQRDDVEHQRTLLTDKEQSLESIESKLFALGNERQQIVAEQQLLTQRLAGLNSQRVKTNSQIELLNEKRVNLAKQQQALDPVACDEQYQKVKHFVLQHDNALQDLKSKQHSLQQFLSENEKNLAGVNQSIALLEQERNSTEQRLQESHQDSDEQLKEYFSNHNQLWQLIDVEAEWQFACEQVLGAMMRGYLTNDIDLTPPTSGHVQLWPTQNSTVLANSLATKVSCKDANARKVIDRLLGQVRCLDDDEQSISLVNTLENGQSIVSRRGRIYKNGVLEVFGSNEQDCGVLALRQRIATLEQSLIEEHSQQEQLRTLCQKTVVEIEALQPQIENAASQLTQFQTEANNAKQKWLLVQQQWEHTAGNLKEVEKQVAELTTSDEIDSSAIQDITHSLADSKESLTKSDHALDALKSEKQLEKQQAKRIQQKLEGAMHQLHQGELSLQKLEMQLLNEQRQRTNLETQSSQINNEFTELTEKLADGDEPLRVKQEQLIVKKQAQHLLSNQRSQLQEQLSSLESSRVEQSSVRSAIEDKKAAQHKSNEQLRLKIETLKVKLQSQRQNTDLSEREIAERALAIADAVDIKLWPERLDNIRNKLANMGAINLTAIEQYNEQKARLDELTRQTDDLESGLQTLEKAIKKIDRESRDKFKKTFNSVNHDFQRLFPKVFGGGSAQLTLTDSDMLTAGVSIMAQPPGKKNSTIHLLSGGEKALTALSLVFAIFQLNPAPFCMLDEVDAPLDDANVDRYCNLVNEMSEKVQFIYITHNKVSMEMANQLTGVTMQEAGVSRIVAVDVDEAVSMAQQ
ncbi:MAG: chromosome segregation protein SMC [Psychrobium sp.]